jgi:hypothetical protein
VVRPVCTISMIDNVLLQLTVHMLFSVLMGQHEDSPWQNGKRVQNPIPHRLDDPCRCATAREGGDGAY